jgi:hypothetical protein
MLKSPLITPKQEAGPVDLKTNTEEMTFENECGEAPYFFWLTEFQDIQVTYLTLRQASATKCYLKIIDPQTLVIKICGQMELTEYQALSQKTMIPVDTLKFRMPSWEKIFTCNLQFAIDGESCQQIIKTEAILIYQFNFIPKVSHKKLKTKELC